MNQENLFQESQQANIPAIAILVENGKEAQERDKSPNYNLFIDKVDRQENLFKLK
jgi:hypothetical protein